MPTLLLEQICNEVDASIKNGTTNISIDEVLKKANISTSHPNLAEYEDFAKDYTNLALEYEGHKSKYRHSKGINLRRVVTNGILFGAIYAAAVSMDQHNLGTIINYKASIPGVLLGMVLSLFDEIFHPGLNLRYVGAGMLGGGIFGWYLDGIYDSNSIRSFIASIGTAGGIVLASRRANPDKFPKSGYETLRQIQENYEDRKRGLINFYSMFIQK